MGGVRGETYLMGLGVNVRKSMLRAARLQDRVRTRHDTSIAQPQGRRRRAARTSGCRARSRTVAVTR